VLGKRNRIAILGDTAGQQKFSTVPQNTLRDQHVLFIVFALDDKQSFRRVWHEVNVGGMVCQPWLMDALTLTRDLRGDDTTKVVVVGNKLDRFLESLTTTAGVPAVSVAEPCGD
jgi:GTPase SAR1 family protein